MPGLQVLQRQPPFEGQRHVGCGQEHLAPRAGRTLVHPQAPPPPPPPPTHPPTPAPPSLATHPAAHRPPRAPRLRTAATATSAQSSGPGCRAQSCASRRQLQGRAQRQQLGTGSGCSAEVWRRLHQQRLGFASESLHWLCSSRWLSASAAAPPVRSRAGRPLNDSAPHPPAGAMPVAMIDISSALQLQPTGTTKDGAQLSPPVSRAALRGAMERCLACR